MDVRSIIRGARTSLSSSSPCLEKLSTSRATLSDDLLDVTANDPPPSNAQDVPAITNSVESVDGPVTTNAENNVNTQTLAIGLDAMSQAAPLSPTLTAPANPHSAGLYHIPHSLPDQQREAARQDVRSGLPLWTQRARQRHAPPTGGNAWTHANQEGIAVKNHIEEKYQPKEAPKRIKCRGGKKNALWKRKCLERRGHHAGAGPSGLH
ncbi:hypothetical protein FRC01_006321 [Tulasnella sp. 417]|nr:hypothetical protein FRC01_006321 [Tulasnella sp. 417]